MVRQNNKKQIYAWVSSSTWLLCGLMAFPANASEFYTIIGPDGRPMVIPRVPAEIKSAELQPQLKQQAADRVLSVKAKNLNAQPIKRDLSVAIPQDSMPQTATTATSETRLNSTPSSIQAVIPVSAQKSEVVVSVPPTELTISASVPDRVQQLPVTVKAESTVKDAEADFAKQESSNIAVSTVTVATYPASPALSRAALTSSTQLENALHTIASNTEIEKTSQLSTHHNATSTTVKSAQDGFLEVNGERYVKNEYLEGHAFNLEKKKRFYVMPEGVVDKELGAPRLQVVEREKGVNQGVLDRLFKSNRAAENSVITLSTQYYPIAKEQVVQSLGQACYQDKKIQKAKLLKAQQDVNLWPRQPLKDQFDYEVVAVQAGIKNVQLSSYASSQTQPSYYWPFVAFLDESGCVIEGVTGFKNQDRTENKYRYAVMDGMLQLPAQTHYIFMTPLLSAVDVEEQALSNQGQIKLTVIR